MNLLREIAPDLPGIEQLRIMLETGQRPGMAETLDIRRVSWGPRRLRRLLDDARALSRLPPQQKTGHGARNHADQAVMGGDGAGGEKREGREGAGCHRFWRRAQGALTTTLTGRNVPSSAVFVGVYPIVY